MPELDTTVKATGESTADTSSANTGKKSIEDYAKQLDTLDTSEVDGNDTPDGDLEPKHNDRGDDKTKAKDTSNGDSDAEDIVVPDEYLFDEEDGLTDDDLEKTPELREKLANFNKGITAKFAKLDKAYKDKVKELEAREKDVTEHEAVLLEALNEGLELPAEKQAALAKLVEKIPYVKELIDRANNLQTEYINLYAQRVRDEAYRHLAELGYSAKEAEALFASDNGKQATKIAQLLTNGLSIEEALRAIGVGSKRKKLTTPVTTTTNTKKDLTYEEKLAKYSKQLD